MPDNEFRDEYRLEGVAESAQDMRDLAQATEQAGGALQRGAGAADRFSSSAGRVAQSGGEGPSATGRGGWGNLALGAALGRSPRHLAMSASRMGGAMGAAGVGAAVVYGGSYLLGRVADSGLIGAASETDQLTRAYRAQQEKKMMAGWVGRAYSAIGLGGVARFVAAIKSGGTESREDKIAYLGSAMAEERAEKREQRAIEREALRYSHGTYERSRHPENTAGPAGGF